jgi:hypothetical protein
MPQQAFNPFAPRVEIYEVASSFVAMAAIDIAAEVAGDLTVPGWLLVMLFFAGVTLWTGAVMWLFADHQRMAAVTASVPVRCGPFCVDAAVRTPLGADSSISLMTLLAEPRATV